MGRLSHACLLHNPGRVPHTTSALHRASLVPCWDISPHRCYTLRQAGARGPPTLPAGMQRQPRRPRWLWPSPSTCCVSKGGPHDVAARWASHMSPVTVGLDGAGRAIISRQETTHKVRNLRRDPRATLCVFVEAFRGP